MSLASFTQSYLETALWSSTDNNGEPMDKNFTADKFSVETLAGIHNDCKQFYNENHTLWDNDERAGHDFWLTRNRHGAGFWDGDYPENGDLLTKHSHTYGECNLYIGDDDLIYVYG